MRVLRPHDKFTITFGTGVWGQVGSLSGSVFDGLLETLEYFAVRASERLASGEEPSVDVAVPIVAGTVIAECTFNDLTRSVTVLGIERCDALGNAAP